MRKYAQVFKMKILVISFYKDFARYFAYIEKNASSVYSNVEFVNLALYPCAWLYLLRNGLSSALVPFSLRKPVHNIHPHTVEYHGYNLESLIQYTSSSLGYQSHSSRHNLKLRAAAYLDLYERLLSDRSYSFIICPGDTRLPVETCIAVAKRYDIKVWFFEQGPFRTTLFDRKGVNYNASFSCKTGIVDSDSDSDSDLTEFIRRNQQMSGGAYSSSESRNIAERCIDWLTLFLMHPPKILAPILPVELKTGDHLFDFLWKLLKRNVSKRKFLSHSISARRPPYIALLLQVPFDAQMISHSPLYNSIEELVQDVIESAPANHLVVVREHPLHVGMYPTAVYDTVNNSHRALVDNTTPLDELIAGSSVVVLNNSTAGLDSMRLGKTLVVLGDAYYAHRDVVYRLDEKSNLSALLQRAIDNPICPELIRRHLLWIITRCHIPGHYHDRYLWNAALVLRRIMPC